jgi:hypothetical protein
MTMSYTISAPVLTPPALTRVVHPLDDRPEAKLYHPALGRMRMTRTVRIALGAVQAYLAAMVLLLAWRVMSGF